MRADGVDLHDAITLEYESGALAQFATSITCFMPPRGWIGGAKGSIDFGERLFSPESMRIVTGTPPTPPTVEDVVFTQEGAGYVPMFREVNERILAGETEHPLHPISATVDILETMERIRERMSEHRDASVHAPA
jgi:hypothetical protein